MIEDGPCSHCGLDQYGNSVEDLSGYDPKMVEEARIILSLFNEYEETSMKQKLIDIVFDIAQASYLIGRSGDDIEEYYTAKRDDHMKWVADQLRACGFDTVQCGSSWGILKNEDK